MNFQEEGGRALQSEKFVAKKCNIVFQNEGGRVRGHLEVFRKFIKSGPRDRPLPR